MDGPPELVGRDELLAGLGARRASIALYALESRAGFLADRARHANAPAICDDLVEAREQAFLAAVAAGRDVPAPVTAQDLERFAPLLAHLVPPEAEQRAALAVRIAAKYRARSTDVPRLRALLGLDEPAVRAALTTRHDVSPDELWSATLPWADRIRWWRSRLVARVDELPPFWTAYALTLTQTVGAGVLALPIALAGLGPLPGLVIVVLLGLVNVITVTAIAESFTRTGSVRWGGAYFGRVVGQHLGTKAQAVVAAALVLLAVIILLAYYVGFSSVLAAATGAPAWLWAAALFGVTAGLVWRGRLDATVATALLVGLVNLTILGFLSVLAFADLELGNITYAAAPGVGGSGYAPAVVAVVFGVVLIAFFGHMSVANCARVVLTRDGSGRALGRGTAAGMLTAVAVYGVWTLAVGGAVHPDRLAGETGTALEPLAETAGPVVLIVGAAFAVLAMGMAAVHVSFGLHFQVRELAGRSGPAGRLVGVAPLLAVFAIAETLLITNNESFTGSLGAAGTLIVPLVAGVVPVLLLVAARRRGDHVPDWTLRWARHRPTLLAVYLVFLLALVLHAVVIWTAPLARLSAGAVAVLVVVLTIRILRSDSMLPLATVEVRGDRDSGRSQLTVVADGASVAVPAAATTHSGVQQLVVEGRADLPASTTAVTVELADIAAGQVRVVAHQVDAAGSSDWTGAVSTLRSPLGPAESLAPDGSATADLSPPATLDIELPHPSRRADGRP